MWDVSKGPLSASFYTFSFLHNITFFCCIYFTIADSHGFVPLYFTRPRLIDMSKVYHLSNLENLEQAFSVAEQKLGVTRLLDPEGNVKPRGISYYILTPSLENSIYF